MEPLLSVASLFLPLRVLIASLHACEWKKKEDENNWMASSQAMTMHNYGDKFKNLIISVLLGNVEGFSRQVDKRRAFW